MPSSIISSQGLDYISVYTELSVGDRYIEELGKVDEKMYAE